MKIEVCPAYGASSCDATAKSVRYGDIADLFYRTGHWVSCLIHIYVVYRSCGCLIGLFVEEIMYIYKYIYVDLPRYYYCVYKRAYAKQAGKEA